MKLLSFILLLLLSGTIAHADQINYYNKSWEEIKAKAKTDNKYILVDCYTEWCSWCKVMDRQTMTDPVIVKLVNERYVAVKMDMEHGEGISIAMKYHVRAFPTFLFFSPDGIFVYTCTGSADPTTFAKDLNEATNKANQASMPGYSSIINLDFPEFYKDAYTTADDKKGPNKTEVSDFLDKQQDLFSEVSWGVMARFELNEKYSDHLLHNLAKYRGLYGNADVNQKIRSLLASKTRDAIKTKSNAAFATILKMTDKYLVTDEMLTKLNLRLDYYRATDNWRKFMVAFDEMMKLQKQEHPGLVNSVCWDMYERCKDKDLLLKACAYMKKAVAAEPEYANMDTYAALLYKTGQMTEAETWAGKAIDQGKEEKADTKPTEELLEQIKATKHPSAKTRKKS